MKYVYLLLTLILSNFTYAQNGEIFKEKIDEKYGFRDVKLEATFASLGKKQLSLKEAHGKLKIYQSKTEDLKVGDYALKAIYYHFYDGILMQVVIYTKGLVNSDGLLKVLQTSYGHGFKGNQYIEQFLWESDKAIIFYDQNSVTHDAFVTISSKRIEEKRKQDEADGNKKAAQQDF